MQLEEWLQRTKEYKPIKVDMRLKENRDRKIPVKPETNNERYTRFAKELGVSLHAVRKWVYEKREISDRMKRKIVQATGGKVSLIDLMR